MNVIALRSSRNDRSLISDELNANSTVRSNVVATGIGQPCASTFVPAGVFGHLSR